MSIFRWNITFIDKKLEINDVGNFPDIDDSFIVNARLILSLSKVNRRIEYTVEDVPSYEKSYLQNQDDNEELAYNEYINKPLIISKNETIP